MTAVESLQREHEWIGWMAEILAALVATARSEGRLPGEAVELLALYETFADGRHQEKEESALFPALLEAADHRAGRAHMESMRALVIGAVRGDGGSAAAFAREAEGYLELHRAHMQREEEVLLPMAATLLTPEADARVLRRFRAIEGGPGDPHGLREQIRGLRKRVGLE
mgnify:CR=1 FL=1